MADIEVGREPLTYEPGAPQSYFRDLTLAETRDDSRARDRLTRHAAELAVEMPKRNERSRRELERRAVELDGPLTGLEMRRNANRSDGQGGYFDPPLWLIDQFATAPRTGRVLSALAPNFALPQGVDSVNVPRLTTGLHAGIATDGTAAPSRDAVDTNVTSSVVTIAGIGDVSMQLLEQSPPGAHLDAAFFKELLESYVAQLEFQLINGNGTGLTADTQLQGLLQVVPSTNAITYTDASPTSPELVTLLAQAVASVGNNRKRPPECWLMTTSRHTWLLSGEDQSLQPVGAFTNTDGPGQSDLLAYPVELDDVIPINLGAGGNQDRIVLTRPSDMLVFESEPRVSVATEVLSGTLQARLSLHGYVAALTGRYPSSTAVISGTGMIVQASF